MHMIHTTCEETTTANATIIVYNENDKNRTNVDGLQCSQIERYRSKNEKKMQNKEDKKSNKTETDNER